MLVKELTALLEECDPDALVFHCDQEFTYSLRASPSTLVLLNSSRHS